MIQKKIGMLGAFATGKTSLTQQFVQRVFSERYLTTVGVRVDRKVCDVGGQQLSMVIWDLHGEDHFQAVRTSYLRGMSGYLLVADGTRPSTLETAIELQARAASVVPDAPFVLLLNKKDLTDQWRLPIDPVDELIKQGWTVHSTSAKTGEHVEESFMWLAERMLSTT